MNYGSGRCRVRYRGDVACAMHIEWWCYWRGGDEEQEAVKNDPSRFSNPSAANGEAGTRSKKST